MLSADSRQWIKAHSEAMRSWRVRRQNSLADGAIKLDLKADVLSSALPAALRPVLGEKLALSTSLERDTEGHVSANALALQSGRSRRSKVGAIDGDRINADVKGTLTEVSPLATGARGTIAFSATATGALSRPDVALTVTSQKMTVADAISSNP